MPRPRKQNTRKFRMTVYAVVEGEKTEIQYVNFLRSKLPRDCGIQIVAQNPGSARQTLFNKARKIVQATDEDTEVWILCDVDDAAAELSRLRNNRFPGSNRLHWAVSNPEFALWLVMHFQQCTSWQIGKTYAGQAKRLGATIGKNGKDIALRRLEGKSADAEANAQAARKHHESKGNQLPDNNPQSDVDLFVGRVIELCNEHGQNRVEFSTLY